MTLRVDISIVPFGREEQKYEIYRLDISNHGVVRDLGFGHEVCEYYGTLYKKSTPVMVEQLGYDEYEVVESVHIPEHDRRDGALSLVQKALDKLEEKNA